VAHAAVVERLGRAGVDVRKVSFTGYPFAQMVDGISTGRIDAGQVAEPFLSPAGNRIRLLFPTFSVFGKFPPSTVIVVNGKWARENPSAAQRFHQAWSKAVLYAARNPQSIRNLMVKQNPAFTPEVMAGQIIPGLTVNPGIPALRNELKRMVKLGMLSKQPDYYNMFIRPRATNRDDVLNGWDRADVFNGGGGNDTILGFEGRDTLNGGPGNDTIEAGVAGDTVSGGPGNDVISAIDNRRDQINCGPGRDLVYADPVDMLVGCERVSRRKPTALLVGLGIEFQ
jgi:Ca2+-binding RTX toxin-like protein